MTEENVKISPEQAYFDGILEKFNKNPDDEELSSTERVLLGKILDTQKEISKLASELEDLNKEISERRERSVQLAQRFASLQGKAQGFLDSLLALR